jgi:N12 class adenine-specific DNA methylase
MKKILVTIGIATYGLSICAQKMSDDKVPAVVKNSFIALYPTAKVIKWEKENELFEAEFNNNNIETSVLFEVAGNMVQTEVEIPVNSLPIKTIVYARTNLAGKKIAEATKITDSKSIITYEVEIGDADYLFDNNGNFISQEFEESENEEDDKD